MTHEREPLTPEERGIAQRLARLEAGATPSAALDARILAAAREGAAPLDARPAPPMRRTPGRWPLGLGVAASLLVAVGVAWQLRPQPEQAVLDVTGEPPAVRAAKDAAVPDAATPIETTAPARRPAGDTGSEPPVAEVPSTTPAAPSASPRAQTPGGVGGREVAAPQTRDERSEAATMARPARVREEAATRAARANAEASRQAARDAAAAQAGSDASLREAPAVQAARAATAAPAAPASPPAAQRERAATHEESGFTASPAPPPPPPAPPAPPTPPAAASVPSAARQPATSTAPEPDQIEVTGSHAATEAAHEIHLDQPLDEQPPASADSPAVRERWLQRIRELLDAGSSEEARESLREFRRRHPQADIPADLRALLDE